jgi:hypothetical protein
MRRKPFFCGENQPIVFVMQAGSKTLFGVFLGCGRSQMKECCHGSL